MHSINIPEDYVEYFYNWYLYAEEDVFEYQGLFTFPDGSRARFGELLGEIMRNPDRYPLAQEL